MNSLSRAFRLAAAAARANLLPGLLLQCLLLVFFTAYVAHDGTKVFLGEVAQIKDEAGYWFAFVSYMFAGALLPEALRIAFFQGGRASKTNLWNFLTAAPAWGLLGMLVDFFYRCQAVWFGTGSDPMTLVAKIFVDQFLYSPLIGNPLALVWFSWRDAGFQASAWRQIFCEEFFYERFIPLQVAGWVIWIPGVALVYLMPPLLQVPVAVLIQVFWVLVFTTLGQAGRTKHGMLRNC